MSEKLARAGRRKKCSGSRGRSGGQSSGQPEPKDREDRNIQTVNHCPSAMSMGSGRWKCEKSTYFEETESTMTDDEPFPKRRKGMEPLFFYMSDGSPAREKLKCMITKGNAWVGLVSGVPLENVGAMVRHITLCLVKVDQVFFELHGKHHVDDADRLEEVMRLLQPKFREGRYRIELDTVGMHRGKALRVICPELHEDLQFVKNQLSLDDWKALGVQWSGGVEERHMTISESDQWPLEAGSTPSDQIWNKDENGKITSKRIYDYFSLGCPTSLDFIDRQAQGRRRVAARGPQLALGMKVQADEMAKLQAMKKNGEIREQDWRDQLVRIGKISARQRLINCCALPMICMECDGAVRYMIFGSGKADAPCRSPEGPLSMPGYCTACIRHLTCVTRQVPTTNTNTTTTTTTTTTSSETKTEN